MNLAKRKPDTIDEYLANVEPHHRKTLQEIRRTIHAAVPNVEECISYGLPAFRLNGRVLVFLGAWTNHCALYPGSAATLKKFRNELKNFQTSKGTIRFSPDRPLPVALVKDLIKTRIAENNNRSNKRRRKL